MNRIREVKSDPMRRRDVTTGPSGGAASDGKSRTNRRDAETCAEMIRRRAITRSRERRADLTRREGMTRLDVTMRLRGGAASVAKRRTNRRGAERCAETIRRRATTRSREICADLTRREEMTRLDVTIGPIGSGASVAKSRTNRKGAETIRHRVTTRRIERRAEMIISATTHRIERRAETINRATIRRIGRCEEMTRRATVRRREASSVRSRLLLRRLLPHAKALLRARRKSPRNAQRLDAGPIFNSGVRESLGLDCSSTPNRPANDGRPVRLRRREDDWI